MQVKIKLLERIQDYYIPVTNLAEEQDGGERERIQGEERGILSDGRWFRGGLIDVGLGTRRLNRTN